MTDLKITKTGMTLEVMNLPTVGFEVMIEGSPEYGEYDCASMTISFEDARALRDYLKERL